MHMRLILLGTLAFSLQANAAAGCDEAGSTGTEYEKAVAKVTCYNELGKTLRFVVQEFGIYDVNSAGGVRPYVVMNNPNQDTSIKYLRIEATMYNQVGDPIRSQIGGERGKWIRAVGPVAFDDGLVRVNWEEPVWYNSTVECLRITSVSVEYMNGKKQTAAGAALSQFLAPAARQDCKVR